MTATDPFVSVTQDGAAPDPKCPAPDPNPSSPLPSIDLSPVVVWADAPVLPEGNTGITMPKSPEKSPRKARYYVVIRGKMPGIYKSWLQAGPLVIGVKGNCHKSYKHLDESLAAWELAKKEGEIFRIVD